MECRYPRWSKGCWSKRQCSIGEHSALSPEMWQTLARAVATADQEGTFEEIRKNHQSMERNLALFWGF